MTRDEALKIRMRGADENSSETTQFIYMEAKGFLEGFDAALREAAKVAGCSEDHLEGTDCSDCDRISGRILALLDKGEKGLQ